LKVSFKVTDDEFDEISCLPGIIPAPYAARHTWVLVENPGELTKKQWLRFITQSYGLVKAKLSKKKQAGLDKNKQ
jgi:predicted DNA-binding protein (MmcQ/YjbR family)